DKKWIHEIDEIYIEGIDTETPEKTASDPKALEKFLEKIYNPANNPQDVQEKTVEEKPAPVEEKPDSLKIKPAPVIKEDPISEEPSAPIEEQDEPIDSFSDCYLSDEES